SKTIESARVLDTIAVGREAVSAHVVLVRIEYTEGDAESYVLPITFAGAAESASIGERLPHAVVARLRVRVRGKAEPEEGVLFDPLGESAHAQALLRAISETRRARGGAGELAAWPLGSFPGLADIVAAEPPSSSMKGELSHTILIYGDQLFLKIF